MKRTVLILMVLGLTTTACGAARSNRRASFTMQPITELAVGTLKLDGTAEAVTQQQASELLPMWEVYKQIVSSETAAQAEIDGLSDQIRETMTQAQQQNIAAMKLGERDVFALMQGGQEGGAGFAARTNGGTRPSGSTGQTARPGGGNNFFIGGGPGGPEGGGFVPGGGFEGGGATNRSAQNGSTAQTATQRLTQSARPQVPAPVLNALIDYLKKKAGGQTGG